MNTLSPNFNLDGHGYSADPIFCDWCLGQAVQALIDDGKEETASLLISCRLSWQMFDSYNSKTYIEATLHGPMSVIKKLHRYYARYKDEDEADPFDEEGPIFAEIAYVFVLVLGMYISIANWGFQVENGDLPTNWRTELLEAARKKGTTNQGISETSFKGKIIEYANLRFRSQSEVKVAQALDARSVMYLANCMARVGSVGDRLNREPDFLVCYKGKWGILEIDGEPFHPPSRKTQEDERDRLFKTYGVRCIEHYDATRCYQEANQVVTEFLDLLAKNG